MDEPMQIAGVILAAGASTRFGSPKMQARIGGRTMLESVIETARLAGLDPIMAVVPPGIAVPPDVVPVVNQEPAAGLSRSLRMGIAALPDEIDAVVILLGDQPTMSVAAIRAVIDAAARGRPIAATRAGGLLAPPVLLMRRAFGLALEANGDEGLRSMLRASSELVTAIEAGEHPPDVDTPADLERLS